MNEMFGYRIRPADAGWSWTAFSARGEVLEQGLAETKAVAAAMVIRAHAREATPAPARAA